MKKLSQRELRQLFAFILRLILQHLSAKLFGRFGGEKYGGDVEDRFASALAVFVHTVRRSCECYEYATCELGIRFKRELIFDSVEVAVSGLAATDNRSAVGKSCVIAKELFL